MIKIATCIRISSSLHQSQKPSSDIPNDRYNNFESENIYKLSRQRLSSEMHVYDMQYYLSTLVPLIFFIPFPIIECCSQLIFVLFLKSVNLCALIKLYVIK